MVDIKRILNEIGHDNIKSCTKVTGGRDSLVWKVITSDGNSYAIRVLSADGYSQFIHERHILQLVFNHGLAVPKIHLVQQLKNCSVMMMDWVAGRTIFDELRGNPENVNILGREFGKAQASIHRIERTDSGKNAKWLTPGTAEEKKLHEEIVSNYHQTSCLLHLDFHPLNVLVDNNKITGTIDWTNASFGDYRFDIARTRCLLRFARRKFSHVIDKETMMRFENAWLKGYAQFGRLVDVEMTTFDKWAEIRMKRDLAQ